MLGKVKPALSRDKVKTQLMFLSWKQVQLVRHDTHVPTPHPPTPSENNTSSKFSGSMKISTTTTAPTEFPICYVVYS